MLEIHVEFTHIFLDSISLVCITYMGLIVSDLVLFADIKYGE